MSPGASAVGRPAVSIRLLTLEDVAWLLRLRRQNEAFLAPFDPRRPPEFFTEGGQREAVTRMLSSDATFPYAILAAGTPVGTITVSNVARGPFQSANVGYWVAQDWNRRGIASAAVGLIAGQAFGPLGLHRLEAGTLVDNVASQRVLRRNEFRWVGYARRYLRIAGAWRDHLLFERTAGDRPGSVGGARTGILVRRAVTADCEALIGLLAAVAAEPGSPLDPPQHDARTERRRLREIGAGGDAVVLVAEEDGRVVGRLDARRDDHPASRHVAEVGFAVAAAARRRGVGSLLLAGASAWAGTSGVSLLEAHVSPINGPALRLLDAGGYAVAGLREAHYRRAGGLVDMLLLARRVSNGSPGGHQPSHPG